MLNKRTIKILREISKITDSAIIEYPDFQGQNENGSIAFKIDLSNYDDPWEGSIPILRGLSGFLSVIDMFHEDREISLLDERIEITHDNIKSGYNLTSEHLMDTFKKIKENDQFERTKSLNNVAEFGISVDDISKISSASKVFNNLEHIIFSSVDGDVKISVGTMGNNNERSNTFDIIKPASSQKAFKIAITADAFKKIPVSDYKIMIKHKEDIGAYRLYLINETMEGFEMFLGVIV